MDNSAASVLCTVNHADDFVLFHFPERSDRASEPVALSVAFADVARSSILHTWIETADANDDECFRLPVTISPKLMKIWAQAASVDAPLPGDPGAMVLCLQVRARTCPTWDDKFCSNNALSFRQLVKTQ
jgi:hypothetical protein